MATKAKSAKAKKSSRVAGHSLSRRKRSAPKTEVQTWITSTASSAAGAVAELSTRMATGLAAAAESLADLAQHKDVRKLTAYLRQTAEEVATSEEVKSALKAAAIGAVVAVPVPIVGPAFGGATAVTLYFVYRGAEGLVFAGADAFRGKRLHKKRPKKKASSGPLVRRRRKSA